MRADSTSRNSVATADPLLEQEAAALLLKTLRGGSYRLDENGHINWVSPGVAELLGWAPQALLGRDPRDLFDRWENASLRAPAADTSRQSRQTLFWHREGHSFPVEYTRISLDDPGVARGTLVVFRDISQEKQQEKQDRNSAASRIAISALLETGLESLSMARQMQVALEIILTVPWLSIQFKGSIFTLNEEGDALILQASKGFHESLLSQCARLPLGHCLCGMAAQSRQTLFVNRMDQRHAIRFPGIEQHGHYCLPILSKGRLLGVLNCYIPADAPHRPEEEAFLVTATNTLAGIIERRQLESQLRAIQEQLAHSASHDSLTGLPNKRLFLEHFQQILATAQRAKGRVALLFIDLDRFKQVNDTFGHDIGDLLLVEVARRITGTLRVSDLVARLGGDEFAAILDQGTPPRTSQEAIEDASRVATKIIEQLQEPFYLNGHPCQIGSSIGISLCPEHGESADLLIRCADQAMYTVKQSGRNHFALFTTEPRPADQPLS
ncbi:MAG: sensor domain-containing diguanylate cyclase [Magnetococcales bacterium]|nr:sensor domain-containing diguanylate cyclase [Magnetococcales bacterium]